MRALLASDATVVVDAGALVHVDRRTATGADQVVATLTEALADCPAVTLRLGDVNGEAGVVAEASGRTVAVVAFEHAARAITRVWVVADPDKLDHWNARRRA